MYFAENYRKLETDKLYQNPTLVDSLFSNLAYLEPRHLINSRKIIEDEVLNYFLENHVKPDANKSPAEQVDEIFEQIKPTNNILSAKHLLAEGYLFTFGKGLKDESAERDRSAFTDVDNYIKRTIAKKLLLDTAKIEHNKLGFENKIKKYIKSIPNSKFENELKDEIKKDSFRLMNAIMQVLIPVQIEDKDKLSFQNQANRKIVCKQDNGWFDIGYEDSDRNEFECSFFVGYIENEDPKTLHIGIRGTEKRAMGFTKYLLNDYPNMDRHYSRIKPFLDEIINQELIKNNHRLNIVVSGHSLGAAMTELMLLDNKDIKDDSREVSFSGLSIANPGGIHILHKIMKGVDSYGLKLSAKHQKFEEEHSSFINSLAYPKYILEQSGCFAFKALAFLSVGAITLPANALIFLNKQRDDSRVHKTLLFFKDNFYDLPFKNKFSEAIGLSFLVRHNERMCRKIANSFSDKVLKGVENTTDFIWDKPIEDSRLVVVNHEQDIVSKVGGLTTNQKRNNTIILNSVNYFFEQAAIIVKTLGTLYHDNNNYIHEIDKITSYKNACNKINNVLQSVRNRTIPDFDPNRKSTTNPF